MENKEQLCAGEFMVKEFKKYIVLDRIFNCALIVFCLYQVFSLGRLTVKADFFDVKDDFLMLCVVDTVIIAILVFKIIWLKNTLRTNAYVCKTIKDKQDTRNV